MPNIQYNIAYLVFYNSLIKLFLDRYESMMNELKIFFFLQQVDGYEF
jgi:hypothetical protein